MKRSIIILVSVVLVFFMATMLFTRFGVFTYVVSGESMDPTIRDGTVGSGDKYLYKLLGLNRFDIIVVKVEENDWIKRLIGKPNEHLLYQNGQLFINGTAVSENFITSEVKESTCNPYYVRDENNQLVMKIPNICQSQGVQLGPDEYFFMGDNRAESYDSRRFIAHIHAVDIIARVFIRYGVCDAFNYFNECTDVHYYFPRFLGVIV